LILKLKWRRITFSGQLYMLCFYAEQIHHIEMEP